MSMFAKLFDSPRFGQLLIKMDAGEDGAPEVRFYYMPTSLGVCSCALGFNDTDAGWELSTQLFERIGMEEAEAFLLNSMPEDLRSIVFGSDQSTCNRARPERSSS